MSITINTNGNTQSVLSGEISSLLGIIGSSVLIDTDINFSINLNTLPANLTKYYDKYVVTPSVTSLVLSLPVVGYGINQARPGFCCKIFNNAAIDSNIILNVFDGINTTLLEPQFGLKLLVVGTSWSIVHLPGNNISTASVLLKDNLNNTRFGVDLPDISVDSINILGDLQLAGNSGLNGDVLLRNGGLPAWGMIPGPGGSGGFAAITSQTVINTGTNFQFNAAYVNTLGVTQAGVGNFQMIFGENRTIYVAFLGTLSAILGGRISIRKNGTATVTGTSITGILSINVAFSIFDIVVVAPGDIIDVYIETLTGLGSLNITLGSSKILIY